MAKHPYDRRRLIKQAQSMSANRVRSDGRKKERGAISRPAPSLPKLKFMEERK